MTNHDDDNVPPHEQIAAWIEGDHDADLSGFAAASYAPHPADGGSNFEGAGEEDVAPADDERPADADTLPREIIVACSHEPQNDTGNGKRLLQWFGADLVHVRDMGWHAWVGTHWEREGGIEAATRCAQKVAERIVLEADVMAATPNEQKAIDAASQARDAAGAIEAAKGAEARKDQRWQMLMRVVAAGEAAQTALASRQVARRKYAISSGNAAKVRNMLDQAMPHHTIEIDKLDADKLAFNVRNGTLCFVADEMPDPDASDHSNQVLKRWRVEFREHNRADYMTKVAPVDYDPKAKCPTFDASLRRFQPSADIRRFLQRYHGYALTGLTGEQCLIFNYGGGSNWKSTFVELMCRISGPYAQTIPFESISGDVQKSGSQASPEFARLPGCRLLRAGEPDPNVQFKEGLIKSLTGGEPMLTRANFKDFFEFRPDFKIVLSGNHKPKISGVDHGIWRRINLETWGITIADHEKRPMPDVLAELMAEASGILNWLVAGTLNYLNGGLKPPPEVVAATAAYRERMDPVGAFVGQCVTVLPPPAAHAGAAFVPARQMYGAFVAWCSVNEQKPWGEKAFAGVMEEKGFERHRSNAGMRYLNVQLHDVPERDGMGRDDVPPHPGADDAPVPV